MADGKSSGSYALNLLILGVAIILVILVQQNLPSNSDSFVGKVPMVPIGNGPYYGAYHGLPPGVYPTGQPQMYPAQLYPAKVPYYDSSIDNVGRPCKGETGCGVLGACMNGVCTVKNQQDTVFDLKI